MKKPRSHPGRPVRDAAAGLALAVAISAAAAAFFAPLSAADVTIGANVNQSTTESGTCGFKSAAEKPCTLITSVVPGQTMIAPCDGTVTRFRLNGFPRPGNHYGLRVVRRNADGSFTGEASSASVAITTEGVNEYPTSLPIAAGDQIGLDFKDSTEDHGVRWVGGSAVSAFYFYAFPADGGSSQPTGSATFYYLFNADIACTPPPPPPPPPTSTVPSNKFSVVKLKGKALTLDLASAGAVTVVDAGAKAKLLKPSGTGGGPGNVKVNLKLTGSAKKKLREKNKIKVQAKIAFTPTGGTTSTQVSKLTIRKPKAQK
jgi:hypothetical protein